MEGGPSFNEEKEMKEDLASPPLPPGVYNRAVEKYKAFVASRLARIRAEKGLAPANDSRLTEEEKRTPENKKANLPYLDRDDDELVPDPNHPGEMIMKKYLD